MLKISAFLQKKCKSANMGSSTVQLHGVDLIDIQIQNYYKNLFLYYIKRMWLHSFGGNMNIRPQGLDIIDTYTNSIVEMYFYLI